MAAAPSVQKPRSNRNIIVVVIIVIIIVLLAIFLLQGGIGKPSTVNISGDVSTNGIGTHPVSIGFTSESTGQLYSSAVINGAYSVTVPNDQTYTVQITGQGLLGIPSGTCTAGTLPVNVGAGGSTSLTNNWAC